MCRTISRMTLAALLLLAGSVSLSGCIVAAPRPAHVRVVGPVHVERVRVWVPGYWTPRHVWVEGGWRYR